MGRPPLPIATFGNIRCKRLSGNKWEASTRFRLPDGSQKRVRRIGQTKTATENKLKEALSKLIDEARRDELSPDSRLTFVAKKWLEEIEHEAQIGTRSTNGARIYRSHTHNWIIPALGELRMRRELTVMSCERLIEKARSTNSYETAKGVRAVLSAICGYAVRHKVIDSNPVRSAKRLARGDDDEAKEVRALTLQEREDLLAKLEQLAERKSKDTLGRSLGGRAKVWRDLPDVVRAMLATGVRIGELLALSGKETDPSGPTVAIDYHIVRVTGQGLVRARNRKGNKGGLLLQVPLWSVPMWQRRMSTDPKNPLFPAWDGGWLDPSNMSKRIKEAFTECGYDWITSHTFRKTVASVLDDAGLPIGDIADQLGNTRTITEQHYVQRKVSNKRTAAALEHVISKTAC